MVKLKNVEVYNLGRAKRAIKNSYSLEADTLSGEFPKAAAALGGNMDAHQSHDAWLKGVSVCFDMRYNSSFMPEFQRYHWIEIVMSTSTMHSLKSMLSGDNESCYTKYVTEETKEQIERLYNIWVNIEGPNDYKNEKKYEAFMKLCHNLPRGLELWCTCSTNYLALKTVVIQRFGHIQYEDWRNFIEACYAMPEFRELCGFTDPKWDLENWKKGVK